MLFSYPGPNGTSGVMFAWGHLPTLPASVKKPKFSCFLSDAFIAVMQENLDMSLTWCQISIIVVIAPISIQAVLFCLLADWSRKKLARQFVTIFLEQPAYIHSIVVKRIPVTFPLLQWSFILLVLSWYVPLIANAFTCSSLDSHFATTTASRPCQSFKYFWVSPVSQLMIWGVKVWVVIFLKGQ